MVLEKNPNKAKKISEHYVKIGNLSITVYTCGLNVHTRTERLCVHTLDLC